MKVIHTEKAPAAIGPYSQALLGEGKVLFISGQLPVNQQGELIGEIEEATRVALKNLEAIVTEAGGTKENLMKLTVLMKDLGHFDKMNGVYAEFFGDHKPARAAYQVAKLPKDAVVEIEAFAVL